ncbi:MAG: hypothetical protein MUC63_08980 [Planctomycetes bacterium]|jgi:hypothetical protein|nr:hypothetical protein [Planctomycetota bacterium]
MRIAIAFGAVLLLLVAAFAAGHLTGRMGSEGREERLTVPDPAPPEEAPLREPGAPSPPTQGSDGHGKASARDDDGESPEETPSQGASGHEDISREVEQRRQEVENAVASRLGQASPPPEVLERAIEILRTVLEHAASGAAYQAAEEELKRRELRKIESAGEIGPLLKKLAENPVPMPELVRDRERFARLLATPVAGPNVQVASGTPLGFEDRQDGTHLYMGAGTFHLPMHFRGSFPTGLTLTGVGAASTLDGEFSANGPVLCLTVEDCTITSQDAFDSRKMLTLILRRVRAAGYNTGAGGSSFMDVRSGSLAVLAEDCTFDGTVGRGGAKHGTVFSLSTDAKLLRFDRCTFSGNREVIRLWGPATAHFDACYFKANRDALVDGASYFNCTFEDNDDVKDGRFAADPPARDPEDRMNRR